MKIFAAWKDKQSASFGQMHACFCNFALHLKNDSFFSYFQHETKIFYFWGFFDVFLVDLNI